MTTTRCDKCGNELTPGYYQVKVDRVYDLCEACRMLLKAWLEQKPEVP